MTWLSQWTKSPFVIPIARRDTLRPGNVFGIPGSREHETDAYVVIDDKNEIGFFRGGRSVWGDVAPTLLVEVLA